MAFISYAQNFEDVILRRALKNVEKGFYIDIGANDPISDSVTKAFYDAGWRGINIEPVGEWFEKLEQDRPDDINLQVAVGARKGGASFYEVSGTGLSTLDKSLAETHAKEQGFEIIQYEVPIVSLTSICEQYSHSDIHFLKIDVEGAEEAVLQGLDLEKIRPWIILIESTRPLSQVQAHQKWESALLASDYEFCYFDGLNRFYVANEHNELKYHLAVPPNVFDDFILSGKGNSSSHNQLAQLREDLLREKEEATSELETTRDKVGELSSELETTRDKVGELNQSSHHWWMEAERLSKELDTVYHGKSWFLTWPLRKLSQFIRWCFYLLKRTARCFLVKTMPFALKYRRMKIKLGLWLRRFLHIHKKLRQRHIYIYVDHTVTCPTNTGVQRVTRGVATSLSTLGEKIRYVKWDPVAGQCVLINSQERKELEKWNGPPISGGEDDIYLPAGEALIPVDTHIKGEGNWLVVPEVTHITSHSAPVTLDLLRWSDFAGLKAAFIFYDAIPLRRNDLHEMAPKHVEYMQHLLLADEIWPISHHSASDLIAFFVKSECANHKTMPAINPIPLSGESYHCERVLEPQDGDPIILSVGSIDPRKNQVALIMAFEAYRKCHPESKWRLILVGNLHPLVADEVHRAQRANKSITYIGPVSDEELDSLYRSCSFTVFPSLEEGFGLPILESLWYGKPCICANYGAMAEVAEGGGCLTIDVRNQARLEHSISKLIDDISFRNELITQAVSRPIISWTDYGASLQKKLDSNGHPVCRIGNIYFWIDATLEFSANTGIQRVARQLAREMMMTGLSLVPVKWDEKRLAFGPAIQADLVYFEKWNGPVVESWSNWLEPDSKRETDWFFMPDLPLNRSAEDRSRLLKYVRNAGLCCSAIFYDAIPWKMRDIYPDHFAKALHDYMFELGEYDLILPISKFSREDLIDFLGCGQTRSIGVDEKIKAVVLPGEFSESSRVTENTVSRKKDSITVLSVGTVEPRKNHETLLHAFDLLNKNSDISVHLIIAGGGHSIEPDLAVRVRRLVENHSNVTWEEGVDDKRIQELYQYCDFTVYPSSEEGFGLPILESLWYAKPCICADSGAMLEVAEDGGCLMVDVTSVDTLAKAIQQMVDDVSLRESLVQEAIKRPFKTWNSYALEVADRMAEIKPVHSPDLEVSKDEVNSRALAMRLTKRPKLSICISTYNRADWLANSLKSWSTLYPEPLSNVEFLVCDNASTDHTSDVVAPYFERSDFSYHCNERNVGMLGNLRETAHHSQGEYIWILGDDDLLMPNAIERVLNSLESHQDVGLVYLNYAFTRIDDARTVTNYNDFFQEATPIVPSEPDLEGPIKTICARNENFFTAIYTLVFRRDHAIKAYSQDTTGRPFSTMLTCIPTTYYVLHNMMDELGVWIGEPQLVVNMNVSWLKYAPLWILERIPEVYDLAESYGVSEEDMDRWREHTLPSVAHYFRDIFENDPLNNAAYFKPDRVIRRFKHLSSFSVYESELRKAYKVAYSQGHPAAVKPESVIFPQN